MGLFTSVGELQHGPNHFIGAPMAQVDSLHGGSFSMGLFTSSGEQKHPPSRRPRLVTCAHHQQAREGGR